MQIQSGRVLGKASSCALTADCNIGAGESGHICQAESPPGSDKREDRRMCMKMAGSQEVKEEERVQSSRAA